MIGRLPMLPLPSQSGLDRTTPLRQTSPFRQWIAPKNNSINQIHDQAACSLQVEVQLRVDKQGAIHGPEGLAAYIELSTAKGTEAELVAVPWKLAPTGHLAHILEGTGETTGNSIASAIRFADQGGIELSAAGTGGASLLPASSPRSVAWPGALSPSVLQASTTTAALERSIAPGQAGAIAAAPAPLAARIMRWVEQLGRQSEAWIRDYRLDDSSAERLADVIRRMAAEEGVQLDRIVINAREVWRTPSPGAHTGAPQCP